MLSIVLVVIIFSLLVIAHEWGHFIVARRNGVKVEEFGIGFPPRMFGRKRKGTIYSINWLPIGGFVRLKGEDGEAKGKDSFASKGYWQKVKIVLAGVTMNLLIAYVLIVILLIAGIPAILPSGFVKLGPIKPSSIESSNLTVLAVNKGSAAEKSGIKVGDKILSINGQNLTTTEQLQTVTRDNTGKEVEIMFTQNGQAKSIKAQLGTDEKTGYLGLASQPIEIARYNPLVALVAGVVVLFQMVIATIAAFGEFIVGLFTRAQVSENVAGPVGIVGLFGGVMQFGWRFALAFIASISLSLAVINSLPIPALDGGRLFIMTLTRLGVKISQRNEALVHWAGFIGLILLIVIVTISDISRL